MTNFIDPIETFSRRSAVKCAVAAGAATLTVVAGALADEPAPDAHKPVILVVSFGTSYNSSRHITIGAIEDTIREYYGLDYEVRRAFTSQIIIDKLADRDGIVIDNIQTALDRCVADGVTELIVQPTHLMNGFEYTDIANALAAYADKIDTIVLGDPLLTSDDDFDAVISAIVETVDGKLDDQTCLALMGHGTEAESNAVYAKLQEKLVGAGHTNVFVATVEATPTFDDVVAAAKEAGFTKAVLRPLMVVAGDHANNDMADTDDPESFASKLLAAGFEDVTCVIEGLGQLVAIDEIYARHVADAIALTR